MVYVDLIVVFGRPFVKRFALCYQTVVLFLLSICDVGVLWPNGWMGQEETWHRCRPRSTPQTGTQLHTPEKGDTIPNFQPCLLWPKGWMDKDATCYEGRPRPRSHCVRLGPSPSPQKRSKAPNFRPMYCGQTAGWIKMPVGTEGGLGPGHIVLDGDPAPPFKGAQPVFGPCLLWPNGWTEQDATW